MFIHYDPTIDLFHLPVLLSSPPSPDSSCKSFWIGSQMLAWCDAYGIHYVPSTAMWSTITTSGAPRIRHRSSVVWTGSEMIVFGGQDASTGLAVNTGGRYSPLTDTWSPTSSNTAVRYLHSAVWTGSEMIVWGGLAFGTALNTGDRYSPSSDTWASVRSDSTAPAGRYAQSGVWTGSEMLVWGGRTDSSFFGDGGRYDPPHDTWTLVPPTTGSPSPRSSFAALWTGADMFVFGGGKQTGSFYCGCSAGTYFRDTDGDGHGDPAQAICGPAPSYVARADDCDDSLAGSWSFPGEVLDLRFTDATTLAWTAPLESGGTTPLAFDVLRSNNPTAAPFSYSCAASSVDSLSATDTTVPSSNAALYYLVRAKNSCPGSLGPLGSFSNGVSIVARACP
jgi:hypothetical protein